MISSSSFTYNFIIITGSNKTIFYYKIKIYLFCFTKVFVCFISLNNFFNPSINFLDAAKYYGIIEAGAGCLSSWCDSGLCCSDLAILINVPPQRTTRPALTRIILTPTQEPGLFQLPIIRASLQGKLNLPIIGVSLILWFISYKSVKIFCWLIIL